MEKTKIYSALFIITPEKQDVVGEVKSSIVSVINDNSGKVESDNLVGKKQLSYPIKKKGEAVYYEVVFNAQPAEVSKMMKQFRINTDILRTLIEVQ